jgi:hypothetical protein
MYVNTELVNCIADKQEWVVQPLKALLTLSLTGEGPVGPSLLYMKISQKR